MGTAQQLIIRSKSGTLMADMLDDDNIELVSEHRDDILQPSDLELYVGTCRKQLKVLISIYKNNNFIDTFDAQILLLRLGLDDKRCYTLIETGKALHMSSENIRRRQYIILRRKIHDTVFFSLLKTYNQYVRLPRGIQQTLVHMDFINGKA